MHGYLLHELKDEFVVGKSVIPTVVVAWLHYMYSGTFSRKPSVVNYCVKCYLHKIAANPKTHFLPKHTRVQMLRIRKLIVLKLTHHPINAVYEDADTKTVVVQFVIYLFYCNTCSNAYACNILTNSYNWSIPYFRNSRSHYMANIIHFRAHHKFQLRYLVRGISMRLTKPRKIS